MTTPVSLPTAIALPGADAPPVTDAAVDAVFASLLAALSTAIGLPVPVPPGQAGHEDDHGTPGEGRPVGAVQGTGPPAPAVLALAPSGTGEAPPASLPGASPVVWAALTQRVVLQDKQLPPKALVAPGHVESAEPTTHGAAVRETTPAAEHAPRPDGLDHGLPPAVAAKVEKPTPLEPARAAAPPLTTAPPAVAALEPPAVVPPPPDAVPAAVIAPSAIPQTPVAHADAPAQPTSTRHVTPAVLEAAGGLRHEGGGRTSLVVRLDPPELGAVLVRLTVQDGRVDVQLRTPDLAARSDLQAQTYDIQQVLREQGLDLSSFDVQHGDVLSDGHGDAPDRGTRERPRGADGHPTHSRVTDDASAPEPSGTWL